VANASQADRPMRGRLQHLHRHSKGGAGGAQGAGREICGGGEKNGHRTPNAERRTPNAEHRTPNPNVERRTSNVEQRRRSDQSRLTKGSV
jgi:hypothetical protein